LFTGKGFKGKRLNLIFQNPPFRGLIQITPDPFPDEERWQTVGLIGQLTVFVVHTWPRVDPITGEETGRIISARKATIYERRAYEEETF
jgi:uncharacterized DUF497 family protein